MRNFPAASKFARKLFQQGISDSHSLLEFSDSSSFPRFFFFRDFLAFFSCKEHLVFLNHFPFFPKKLGVQKREKSLFLVFNFLEYSSVRRGQTETSWAHPTHQNPFLACVSVRNFKFRRMLKYHPFWGITPCIKHPQDNFQPPKCKLAPSTMLLDTLQKGIGDLFVKKYTGISDRKFAFWRASIYILGAESVLGVLYR